MYQRCISGLLRCLAVLPWWCLRGLGYGLGWLLYAFKGREVQNVLANVAITYPALDAHQRSVFTRQALYHSAITYLEMPRIWLSSALLSDRIDDQGLAQVMSDLLAQGRGLILAMPHLGNWEMVSSAVDPRVPITGLYRPPRQAWLEPMVLAGRNKARIRTVSITKSGLKALHSALKAQEVVAILPDQVPKSASSAAVSAPFFGRDALTMVLLNRLARRHQSPVLWVWAKRLPTGRYQIRYSIGDEQLRAADPLLAATALNQAIEACVADCPTQYQWAYRRFKPVNPEQDNPY